MTLNNRYIALDVFRGITICLMIIVNTPGSHATNFSQLEHAQWNGFTLADLVFPSFLFAVGNALCFAYPKWKTLPQTQVLAKIGKRSLLLFLLGFLLYWFPFVQYNEGHLAVKSLSDTRVLGVLQRIALCYGIAAVLICYLKTRALVIISIGLLVSYQLILWWLGQPGQQYAMTGNAGTRLDLYLLGASHMNHGEVVPFEPEGLLSTWPAIVNVIAGYLAGRFIQLAGISKQTVLRLLVTGIVLVAGALCWNVVFPINKNLWTSSFVLLTVGLNAWMLAAISYTTDLLRITRWTYFFEVFGRNALFIYLLSEVTAIVMRALPVGKGMNLYKWIFEHVFCFAGRYTGSLLFALWFMGMCWLAGWLLDKKKIYIRV